MKRFINLLLPAALAFSLAAQPDSQRILLTIGQKKITAAEFERIYKKNNTGEGAYDRNSVEEYVELFINFKLKVIEAEQMGLDTIPSFIRELEGYRTQLAKPYLTDEGVTEKLIQEAYERMKTEVNASHILVKLPPNPTSEDTLKGYEKVMKIMDRIRLGEPFENIARGVSDDPRVKSDGGNLGYFTAFRMIYPFESTAYSAGVGEIAPLLRTQFGYHIIRINDKRQSLGEVKVAHIMISTPQGSSDSFIGDARTKAYEIYQTLLDGAPFDTLAVKFSDDRGTAGNGGELPWFGTGRMVPEFEEAAFSLSHPGELSEPVKTSYGWHIIRLIDRKSLGTLEELRSDIRNNISRDSRATIARQAFIDNLKNEYGLSVNQERLSEFRSALHPDFLNNFSTLGQAERLNGPLFSFANHNYSQKDLMAFIRANPRKVTANDIPRYVDLMVSEFIGEELLKYEDAQLEDKYPEFRYLMQEYHDGILLFELTDRMVWSKAVQDTAGLTSFYQKHKNNYLWDDRVDATIFRCRDGSGIGELQKMLKKREKKGYTTEDYLNNFNTRQDEPYLAIERITAGKGESEILDRIRWQKGISGPVDVEGRPVIILIHDVLREQPKTLEEAKGIITSDYQDYLDREWIRQLKEKYPVHVDREALQTIK